MCTRGPSRAPRQLRGETASSEPLDTLHPGPLSSPVDMPTHLPADPGAAWAGPPIPEPTQDPMAESRPPSHSLERDASPRSCPVLTSRPRPGPSPGHGPPRPQVTERGASLGQGGGLGLCGAALQPGRPPRPGPDFQPRDSRVCCRPPRSRIKSWNTTVGPQPPPACPAAPRSRRPWCQQGAQGQGHPGCRARAGLSQRVSGTEDGLSA